MKKLVGMLVIIGGAIAGMVLGIKRMIVGFQNPDMTNNRILIENPEFITIGLIIVVVVIVGEILIKD